MVFSGEGGWSLWFEGSATLPLARCATVMPAEEVAFRGNLEKKLMIYQIDGNGGKKRERGGKVCEQNN